MKRPLNALPILLPLLILPVILAGCPKTKKNVEDNAVLVEMRLTETEARDGCRKEVQAPDGRYFTLLVPKGVVEGTPVKLPPEVAKTFAYPLYFVVKITRPGVQTPEEREIERIKKLGK